MRVTRSKTTLPVYRLESEPLESVSSYKYLGVHITCDLTWNDHITYIINKANSMLGYIRRNFSRSPSSLKLVLYKSLIRSKLEYAASVWDPAQENLSHALEMIQNNSIRFICSQYNRTASITAMRNNLNLPSLASRRKMHRLALFHKLYYHPHLHSELITPPQYVSNRLDHIHKVGIPSCRTRAFLNSFIPRTSKEWNCLPALTAEIKDCELFMRALPLSS